MNEGNPAQSCCYVLQQLDLSWNPLGSTTAGDCVSGLATALSKCSTLTHLDISHTNLTVDQGSRIGEALKTNYTLVGIHVAGNPFFVNAQGFIQPRPATKASDEGTMQQVLDSVEAVEKARQVRSIVLRRFQNCVRNLHKIIPLDQLVLSSDKARCIF